MWETWVWSLGWEDPLEKGRLPTPVYRPREFHGLYGSQGRKESETTEQLSLSLSQLRQNWQMDWVILYYGGCPVYCWMYSSIPGASLTQRPPRHFHISPFRGRGQNPSQSCLSTAVLDHLAVTCTCNIMVEIIYTAAATDISEGCLTTEECYRGDGLIFCDPYR